MMIIPAISTHKKCFKCGNTTSNMEETTCKCGGFLYVISQIYGPKVVKKK